MKDYLKNYLNDELLPRITAYKSPTDPQKTIIFLADKWRNEGSLDDEDMTLLELHLKAEKQAEKLYKARQKAQEIEKQKKDKERKHKTRMKIVLGGLIEKNIKNDPDLRSKLVKLVNAMDDTEKDKEALKTHLRHFDVDFSTSDNITNKNISEGDVLNEYDNLVRNDFIQGNL